MAYTEEEINTIFNQIIDEIENGASLRSILARPETPSTSTFYIWLDSDEEKSKRYARATSIRADIIFDEILEISDTTIEGSVIHVKSDGTEEVRTGDMLGHRRLQIDARKWVLSKMTPTKYGDKLDVTSNGDSVKMPIIVQNEETKDELNKLIDEND